MELTITQPDDWHLHLRDGDLLEAVIPHNARHFGRVIVMPNLKPPITSTVAAVAYRESILKALPKDSNFTPLMTLYLTDMTSHDEIKLANVWLEIAGPTKKGRVHGLGHGLELSTDGSMSTTSACGTSSATTSSQEIIHAAVNAAMTSFISTRLAQMMEGILSWYTAGLQASNLAPVPPPQAEEPIGQVAKAEDDEDDDLGF